MKFLRPKARIDDEDDEEFPFAGHRREWIENYARMMRDMAASAATDAIKAEFLDAALEAESYLARTKTSLR